MDIFLTFFTMYPAPAEFLKTPSDAGQASKTTWTDLYVSRNGNLFVASHRKIALRYVCSKWFYVDVGSMLPSLADITFDGNQQSSSSSPMSADTFMILLRLAKASKIVKLVRLVTYQRTYRRLKARSGLPCATQRPNTTMKQS